MKRIALVLLLTAFVLMVILPVSLHARAEDDGPTPTWTPNPTTTYEAAVSQYTTVADKNIPNAIVLGLLCLVVVLPTIGWVVFRISRRGR